LEAIHDHTLQARERQLSLLRRTRRRSQQHGPIVATARAPGDGFVTAIDLDVLEDALRQAPRAEIGLHLPIGGYAAYHDPLAEVRASSASEAEALVAAVARAVRLERERDLEHDPAFGLEQIETIAWTTISTSKQDPNPGLEAARNLRDLLARWAVADEAETEVTGARLAVVYPDDVLERLMGTLESLAVVASESMQHQTFAEILRGLATTLDRLPAPLARRTEEVVRRSLTGLGDHVLTAELDAALAAVAAALERAGMTEGARDARAAQAELATTIGHLHSRATRGQE
jgi:uncharacterized membrane protein